MGWGRRRVVLQNLYLSVQRHAIPAALAVSVGPSLFSVRALVGSLCGAVCVAGCGVCSHGLGGGWFCASSRS
eukprot:10432423-Prorocentrum_lima.AAC.1